MEKRFELSTIQAALLSVSIASFSAVGSITIYRAGDNYENGSSRTTVISCQDDPDCVQKAYADALRDSNDEITELRTENNDLARRCKDYEIKMTGFEREKEVALDKIQELKEEGDEIRSLLEGSQATSSLISIVQDSDYSLNEKLGDLGFEFLKAQNLDRSVEIGNFLVDYGVDLVRGYTLLGHSYASQGNKELALECFNEAIKLDAQPHLYSARSYVHKSLGNEQEAKKDEEKLEELLSL